MASQTVSDGSGSSAVLPGAAPQESCCAGLHASLGSSMGENDPILLRCTVDHAPTTSGDPARIKKILPLPMASRAMIVCTLNHHSHDHKGHARMPASTQHTPCIPHFQMRHSLNAQPQHGEMIRPGSVYRCHLHGSTLDFWEGCLSGRRSGGSSVIQASRAGARPTICTWPPALPTARSSAVASPLTIRHCLALSSSSAASNSSFRTRSSSFLCITFERSPLSCTSHVTW